MDKGPFQVFAKMKTAHGKALKIINQIHNFQIKCPLTFRKRFQTIIETLTNLAKIRTINVRKNFLLLLGNLWIQTLKV